jgi:hypothetical protein
MIWTLLWRGVVLAGEPGWKRVTLTHSLSSPIPQVHGYWMGPTLHSRLAAMAIHCQLCLVVLDARVTESAVNEHSDRQ